MAEAEEFPQLEYAADVVEALEDVDKPVYARTPHGSYLFVIAGVENITREGEDVVQFILREVPREMKPDSDSEHAEHLSDPYDTPAPESLGDAMDLIESVLDDRRDEGDDLLDHPHVQMMVMVYDDPAQAEADVESGRAWTYPSALCMATLPRVGEMIALFGGLVLTTVVGIVHDPFEPGRPVALRLSDEFISNHETNFEDDLGEAGWVTSDALDETLRGLNA